jgi:ABC-type antimicrobial peptide transport system permease subunit
MTALRRFATNRLAVVGAVALAILVLFAVLGPLVYPTEQVATWRGRWRRWSARSGAPSPGTWAG